MITNNIESKSMLLFVSGLLYMLLTGFIGNAQNVGINTSTPLSSFEVNGSMDQAINTVTASTTLDATLSIVICNNGSTAITITLPTVSTCKGMVYTIKRNSTSTAKVTVEGTIDGVTNFVLNYGGESVMLFSNGSEWKTTNNSNASSLTALNLPGNAVTETTSNFIGTTDTSVTTSNQIMEFSPIPLASRNSAYNPSPTKLLKLYAQYRSAYVDVSWETNTETNNQYFTLESSPDALSWQFVTTVAGAGYNNAVLYYSYTDTNPFAGITYYRLKQTDADGKSQYIGTTFCTTANIIALDESPQISVTSNGMLHISVMSYKDIPARISVYDVSGRIVSSVDVDIMNGQNTFDLNAGNLHTGIYIVSVTSEAFVQQSMKFMLE